MSALEDIIYPVIDVLPGTNANLPKHPDTVLFGLDAPLDSMALITFIMGVEEQTQTATGQEIHIMTPETLDMEPSPFQTLGSLANYIDQQLQTRPAVQA
jgi:acyl carrier protein